METNLTSVYGNQKVRKLSRKYLPTVIVDNLSGYDWYLSQFPVTPDEVLLFEISPGYISHPLAPQRIFQSNSKAKMVFILRDPFQRMLSDFHDLQLWHQWIGSRGVGNNFNNTFSTVPGMQ